MALRTVMLALLAAPSCNASSEAANPIRKVVTMLQNMQAKVTAEGKKELELFDKFQCYCKTGGGELQTSISNAETKISNVDAAAKEASAKKAQTTEDLEQHQTDRADAKSAIQKATALRSKEASEYAKESSDLKQNIAALAKATTAIETGATGFVQTSAAAVVRTLAMEKADISDDSRQVLLAFLSGTSTDGYVPQSGQILGILKTMHDEMSASLADANSQEQDAIQTYDALMAAKKKEIAALAAQIETEMQRVGELSVAIASMSNDLEDTQQALANDRKFLAELSAGCDQKSADWDQIQKTRAEELVALAETIKVLNDDDALDLFKKTLPSASASFVEVGSSTTSQRAKALKLLQAIKKSPQLDFIEMAINGKKIGFAKVIKLIDELVVNLKAEQTSDDNKRDYCNSEFDSTDDKKKSLEQSSADSDTAIEELEGGISALNDEIAGLKDSISALDKSVSEATEQRKAEHSDHTSLMANDNAAKEVLAWAKNRLNKFYQPKLYVAPPKRELSEEDRITVNMGGTLAPTYASGIADTGITVGFVQNSAAPAAPPAAPGPYQKKTGEGNGVIAMIDLLVKDLTKEMSEADVSEKDAQGDYEKLMADSSDKRAQLSKSLTDRSANKANAEEALQAEQDKKSSTQRELTSTLEVIHSLHGECDWLVKYYDARKAARAGEVDALGNAKAVLNGADYALVQVVRAHTQTCPSTSVQCGMTKDAAGDTVFVPTDLPAPDTCVNVASQIPADGEFKICGPGTFTLSRMSCDRHDYKAITIAHATDAFTVSDCQTYKVADFYQIHGYIGSAKFSCDATAR